MTARELDGASTIPKRTFDALHIAAPAVPFNPINLVLARCSALTFSTPVLQLSPFSAPSLDYSVCQTSAWRFYNYQHIVYMVNAEHWSCQLRRCTSYTIVQITT